MIVTPHFNLAATMGFLDPFRLANYLSRQQLFTWNLLSASGGGVSASNRIAVDTDQVSAHQPAPWLAVISSSWTPEVYGDPTVLAAVRRWTRFGTVLGAIDTGAFILAAAGLLSGRRATVHYEHLDAFGELYPDVEAVEDLYVLDGDRVSVAGGTAATDLALQLIRSAEGQMIANAAARHVFHDRIRPPRQRQNSDDVEPTGGRAPARLSGAIKAMERQLEDPLSIREIAAEAGVSQRQLERLFLEYVGKSPQQYYRDARLDRARGLVTQTEMPIWEVALACGFSSPEHFSRTYRARYGLAPRADRIEGRVAFEFRAWPMPEPRDISGRET